MTAVVDQIIKGVSDSVVRTLQEQGVSMESKSVTDQLVDGFLSGSTITKVVYLVVIGGGIISIIILGLKLAFGKKDPDVQQDLYGYSGYDPYGQAAQYQMYQPM